MDFPTGALVLAGSFFLLLACFGWRQPRLALNIAHWGQLIENLDEPADHFYARVYQRLQQRLEEAGLPDSRIGFGSGHLFGNRTLFGARPQYLIVRYSHLSFYIYTFSLSYGLYVSYWAFSKYTAWENHPVLKWLLFWREYQMTLYQYDVTEMCLTTIQGALHEVIEECCAERGLKPLEPMERRPVLQGFYARYKQGGAAQSGYVLPVQMPMSFQEATPAREARGGSPVFDQTSVRPTASLSSTSMPIAPSMES